MLFSKGKSITKSHSNKKIQAPVNLLPHLDKQLCNISNLPTKGDSSSDNAEKCTSFKSHSRVKKQQKKSSAKVSKPENGLKAADSDSSNDNWDAETMILEPQDWQLEMNEQLLAVMNSTEEYHSDSDGHSSVSTVELNKETDSPQDKILEKTSLTTNCHKAESSNLENLVPSIPLKIPQQQYANTPQTADSKATSSCFVPNKSSSIQMPKRRILQAEKTISERKMKKEHDMRWKRKLPDSISLVLQSERQSSIKQTKCVKDVLAKRGVALIPGNNSQSPFAKKLNSEVSIIPSPQQHTIKPEVSKILTVDLTQETSPSKRSVDRRLQKGSSAEKLVCEVCDKTFFSAILLFKHMACHKNNKNINTPNTNCSRLQDTQQNNHFPRDSSPEIALPVINLCESRVKSRMTALGINSVIPLSQLHSSSGGAMFGLPVVPIELALNPAICNIGGISACNVMPLGKLKQIFDNTN